MPTLPPQLEIQPLPGPFDVTFDDLPGSKSITNRALLLAALAEGTSTLTNVLFSDDTRVMMTALEQLGFKLDINEANLTVTVEGRGGAIPNKTADLHLGNAGTAVRFLTAACCLGQGNYVIDGVERMRQRPIGQLVDALRRLGARIDYLGEEGFPPLRINACGLAGGAVRMNPGVSSQFVSALLQVAPFCKEHHLTIEFISKPVSFPYIEMTLTLMSSFGCVHVAEDMQPDNEIYTVQAGPGKLEARSGSIEPDASNASYFLAVAAITPDSRCAIKKLGRGSVQGDAHFADVLAQMGATVDINDDSITVSGPGQLVGIDVDLNDMPDMAQTLAVVALFGDGPTTIRNVGNLRVKETDRLAALQNELVKLGAKVAIDGDDIKIEPPANGKLTPAVIETYDDHRMAMSFAVAGLRCPGVTIKDPACVNKTFPRFFEYLERLRT